MNNVAIKNERLFWFDSISLLLTQDNGDSITVPNNEDYNLHNIAEAEYYLVERGFMTKGDCLVMMDQ